MQDTDPLEAQYTNCIRALSIDNVRNDFEALVHSITALSTSVGFSLVRT
jgi:hypothetical protein